jgi:hypothetical protein
MFGILDLNTKDGLILTTAMMLKLLNSRQTNHQNHQHKHHHLKIFLQLMQMPVRKTGQQQQQVYLPLYEEYLLLISIKVYFYLIINNIFNLQ